MAPKKGLPSLPNNLQYHIEKDQTTYTYLLEEENQQLKRTNQQLLQRLQYIKSIQKVAHGNSLNIELRQRDKMVAEIATTIISAFQQYKSVICNNQPSSSKFEDDSEETQIGKDNKKI